MKPSPPFGSILVLCEGNHCRSPIAEALLVAALAGSGVSVASAGLHALAGCPADEETVRLLAGDGLDICRHLGRQVTVPMLLAADLILVMDQEQRERCAQLAPSTRGRIFLMGHWRGLEIADPYGQGPDAIRTAYGLLRASVADWLPYLIPAHRSA